MWLDIDNLIVKFDKLGFEELPIELQILDLDIIICTS